MKFLYTSTATGKVCAAKTLSSTAALLVLAKFAVSGLTLFGLAFPEFDTVGASMLLGVFFLGYTKRESDKAGVEPPKF